MICIVFDAATIIAVDDDVWGVHIFQINQLHALAFLINDFWTFETSILEHNYRRRPAWLHPWSISSFKLPRRYLSKVI